MVHGPLSVVRGPVSGGREQSREPAETSASLASSYLYLPDIPGFGPGTSRSLPGPANVVSGSEYGQTPDPKLRIGQHEVRFQVESRNREEGLNLVEKRI
jgi:hypothetical protein